MSTLVQSGFRRVLIAAGIFAGVLLAVAPASAEHGRRYGHYRSHGPRVGVFVGLPPIILQVGHAPRGYYDDRNYREDRAYDNGYEDGYDDGYDDRAREEWRRREYYRHSRYDHRYCDHDRY